jgi:hypothetical protein
MGSAVEVKHEPGVVSTLQIFLLSGGISLVTFIGGTSHGSGVLVSGLAATMFGIVSFVVVYLAWHFAVLAVLAIYRALEVPLLALLFLLRVCGSVLRIFSYGWSDIIAELFTTTYVSRTPYGFEDESKTARHTGCSSQSYEIGGLFSHSALYTDRQVLADISEWLHDQYHARR